MEFESGTLYRLLISDESKAVGLSFFTVAVMDTFARRILKSLSPDTSSKKVKLLALDLAQTPLRLCMIPLNLPIIVRAAVFPSQGWTQFDTKLSTLSWIVLSSAYIFEMISTTTCFMSLVHHSIAFGACACVNLVLLGDAPDNAHWLRLLSSTLVFAVAFGGMFTTSLRLLYHFARQGKEKRVQSIRTLASILTWGLTTSVACAWLWKIVYFTNRHLEMYSKFRLYTPLLIVVALVIYAVQWHWILLFHRKKNALWQREDELGFKEMRKVFRDLPTFICGIIFMGLLYGSYLCGQSVVNDLKSYNFESLL